MGAKKIKAPAKAAPNTKVLPTDTRYEMVKEWADKNYTFLVGIGAAIIFVFISTWGVTYYKGSKEAKAQIEYAAVASKLPA
ncbi:MAG: hypothetical protein LLG06_14835, partial [Desulfobacteraceae bacterium]|nr:hypothetical protein [Desulfobacteraceae bacterium]